MDDGAANEADVLTDARDSPAAMDRLRAEIADLRTSRRRLVSAADADRRVLERDLHDGLQQELVALAVDVRRLGGLIDADPVAARALLDGMTADIRTAMTDAAALAERIHPPMLSERGFAGAVRSAAEHLGITVLVDAPVRADRQPEVTTAVYWTCVETLSCASAGSEATVRLADTDGPLTFDISIDGHPSEELLTRLRDRIGAFDGGVALEERADGGSRVHGWLPSSR
ncbi:MAG TPA: histidine kinase [Candidatus Limnocylindrales bacterium]|jgi:signal transduction histidine kinase|nr:histidine kinase [Candidatus Limnocylindrales bacterium]